MGRIDPDKVIQLTAVDDVTGWYQAGSRSQSAGIITFHLIDVGAWNGTVAWQGTLDNGVNVFALAATAASTAGVSSTATAAGGYRLDASGGIKVRGICTVWTNGHFNVQVGSSDG